jgi:hypothetical protein
MLGRTVTLIVGKVIGLMVSIPALFLLEEFYESEWRLFSDLAKA